MEEQAARLMKIVADALEKGLDNLPATAEFLIWEVQLYAMARAGMAIAVILLCFAAFFLLFYFWREGNILHRMWNSPGREEPPHAFAGAITIIGSGIALTFFIVFTFAFFDSVGIAISPIGYFILK